MWIARFSCRSPPRCSRCRIVLPELAGIGAVPACRAKHASLRNRLAPAVRPMITAAVTVPMRALLEQLRGVGLDQVGELVEQLALFFLDLR